MIKKAKNDIVLNFVRITENDYITNITKKSLFNHLVNEQITYRNLPADFKFPYETARSRIKRKSLTASGRESPLKDIDRQVVDLILCMSRIKNSLTPFEGLELVNDLIENTEGLKLKLIDWKLTRNIYYSDYESLGRVGPNWWRSFMDRNGMEIASTSSKKRS